MLCRIEPVNWQCNDLDKDITTQKKSLIEVRVFDDMCRCLRIICEFFWPICALFFADKVVFSHFTVSTLGRAMSHIYEEKKFKDCDEVSLPN